MDILSRRSAIVFQRGQFLCLPVCTSSLFFIWPTLNEKTLACNESILSFWSESQPKWDAKTFLTAAFPVQVSTLPKVEFSPANDTCLRPTSQLEKPFVKLQH